MVSVITVNTDDKSQVERFVKLPFRLYKNHPKWVPPILIDARLYLNRNKHPYYEHSDADFFIAERDGRDVGRIAAMVNTHFNEYHGTKEGQFYFFDCENDPEAAEALFNRAFDWLRARGMTRVIGPKGFGPLDGYGLLIEGFEHRQMMTMMNYNFEYYPKLVESFGFQKEVDFVSCYAYAPEFRLPERIHRIAQRVLDRGTLSVQKFTSKQHLKDWAPRIGKAYNDAFVNNWEYVPLTGKEIDFVLENIITIADPRLIKVITHGEDAVGFLFGFADLSAAMQRAKGKLFPFGLLDLLLEMRRTKWVSLNGIGILPEFQGRGGNALLYAEIEDTVRGYQFEHADLTQVAETAVQMRSDLINLGGKPYKNHRVYQRDI